MLQITKQEPHQWRPLGFNDKEAPGIGRAAARSVSQPSRVHSDGWDDVARSHLVNCLYSTAGASFFEGTTELDSYAHEDSISIANFLVEAFDRLQPPVATVVHVVTDICSTMKGAWRIVERERPWVSATCCAPHVLNLLLKDIASIPQVHRVMEPMESVLQLFGGRFPWTRTKLKELTKENLGKSLNLYRAKITRFAGKVSACMCTSHAISVTLTLSSHDRNTVNFNAPCLSRRT